jgi:hypothetical protein
VLDSSTSDLRAAWSTVHGVAVGEQRSRMRAR